MHPYGINIKCSRDLRPVNPVSERRATPATKMRYIVSRRKFHVTIFPIRFG